MAEFNNNPSEFVDFNNLFPVLNERVGLTYEQWRKAIENINFVKNNLGVSDIEVGNVNHSIVDDDTLVGVDITTREGIVEKNGVQRTVIYLDFDLRFPAGKVKSVNGKIGAVELSAQDIGAVNAFAVTINGNQSIVNDSANGILIKSESTLTGSPKESSMTTVGGEIFFQTTGTVKINGSSIATIDDINNAINGMWEESY